VKNFIKKHLPFTHRSLKQQRGIALLLAVFTVVMITYLVVEISYESNIEYIVNANAVSRLKAYYAARSGLELSLVRIKLYKKVQKQLGKQMGSQAKLLDLVWNFPFAWPLMVPEGASSVDKEMIKDTLNESKMDASYSTRIEDEGSKLDVNDLDSESKVIREATKKQLLNIFEGKMQEEDFARRNREVRFEDLVNNIQDWVDADTQSQVRGNESDLYSEINTADLQLPPNRAFRTVDEIRLVAGMTEEFFNLLKERVTVYGMKAINPNHASKEVLMSLDNSINEEVVGEIIKRRTSDDLGGPFKDGSDFCKGDFWGFVESKGGRIAPETKDSIPLKCSEVTNFRIHSVGEFAGVTREIEAVVYDLKLGAGSVATQIKKEAQTANPNPGGGSTNPGGTQPPPTNPTGPANEPLPKGPPRIVYYNER
jgi:general secretion pathway protein K